VIEQAGLPRMTGLDDPSTLQAFIDAALWSAATNADRDYLQAPFRSGVSIEDFQLDPLVRAIDMARTSLLIADDVGLGKTIEAGLVVQEMLLQQASQRKSAGSPVEGPQGELALHRAGQADAERLHQELQWPDARRAAQ
jgi:hypothetical protein